MAEIAVTTRVMQVSDAWRAAALPIGFALMILIGFVRLLEAGNWRHILGTTWPIVWPEHITHSENRISFAFATLTAIADTIVVLVIASCARLEWQRTSMGNSDGMWQCRSQSRRRYVRVGLLCLQHRKRKIFTRCHVP
jgi:hypothetical protein